MKINFMYINSLGCEWLKETQEVNGDYLEAWERLVDYLARTEEEAKKLSDKWEANGEEESACLYPDVECPNNNLLAGALNNYLDSRS